jgi:uncharacterized protein (TIGR03067 family)
MKPLLAMAIGLSIAADNPMSDSERIQGNWKVTEYATEGNQAVPQELRNFTVFVSANVILIEQGERTNVARYKLDPTKNPKAIDMTPLGGVDEGRRLLGIYELSGDNLKLCWTEKGERPKEFKGGASRTLIVLQRRKA